MGDIIFKRKLYDKMLNWKRERNGSTALLIKGDRILHRYLIYTKDLRKDADILMVPVFLTMFL